MTYAYILILALFFISPSVCEQVEITQKTNESVINHTNDVTDNVTDNVLKSDNTTIYTLTIRPKITRDPFSASINSGDASTTPNTLSFEINGSESMYIDGLGNITITGLADSGVIHTDGTGLLSTSSVVNADIADATISNAKLATIASTNTPGTIVVRDGSGNFSAGTITANLSGNATSTTNFSGSLVGDVTGTQSATVVSTVGGQSAATVASTTSLVSTATSNNVASTIVKRDASGDFSAGTITATLNGNATSTTNFSGSLVGNVTGTQGATVVSTVGGQTATNVAAATVLANAATNLNTANAIVRRDASGNFSAGTITASLNGNATSTTNFSGSLAGDVTGTQSATVISNAVSTNTANAIVRRDASGNFSAGTITAAGNLVLSTNPSTSTTGNILKGSSRFIHNFGTSNTFVGVNSGNFTMTGANNSGFGINTLDANTSGANNTAIGQNALGGNTTGSSNIGIGLNGGSALTTGSNNIAIGNVGVAAEANTIRIGTIDTHTRVFMAGINPNSVASPLYVSVDTVTGQLGVIVSSIRYKENVQDMNAESSPILDLRPVTFNYKSDASHTKQFGLIAEEVNDIMPALVVRNANGEIETVKYHELASLLLNELIKQHMTTKKQSADIESLTEIINDLKTIIEEARLRIKSLEDNAQAA